MEHDSPETSTDGPSLIPIREATAYGQLQIVIPVYNDWDSVQQLLPLIDRQLGESNDTADILLIDDGSREAAPQKWQLDLTHITAVRVLKLYRNCGHQRAICIGLSWLHEETECREILVMDGDGEDAPADIPRLLAKLRTSVTANIAFAERTKRSEGWVFSLFYLLYRALHLMLVGQRVRVGNFSVMNRTCLESLCRAPELWNHYAASVFSIRESMAFVPTHRATRLAGHSQMNFPSLVMHGLSALSVFSDRISTRLLILSILSIALAGGGALVGGMLWLTTGYLAPEWATTTAAVMTVLLVQIATFMFTFSFLVLFTRGLSPFLPVRDFGSFVRQIDEVWHGSSHSSGRMRDVYRPGTSTLSAG